MPEKYLPIRIRQIVFMSSLNTLIPIWRFFAPIPGTETYYLLYRDYISDNEPSRWYEIPIPAERKWINLFWNPQKTLNKAIIDIVNETVGYMNVYKDRPSLLKLSIPYLTVLTYISNIPRIEAAVKTQFIIMSHSPDTGFRVLYLSDVHNI